MRMRRGHGKTTADVRNMFLTKLAPATKVASGA